MNRSQFAPRGELMLQSRIEGGQLGKSIGQPQESFKRQAGRQVGESRLIEPLAGS